MTPAAYTITLEVTMRPTVLSYLAAALVLAGCGVDGEARDGASIAIALQDSSGCGDAPEWRQRSAEARSQGLESSSDQARITHANRENFFASMAIAADLQCIVRDDDADHANAAALEAARAAEANPSFYGQTIRWGEANHAANKAIELLVQQVFRQNSVDEGSRRRQDD